MVLLIVYFRFISVKSVSWRVSVCHCVPYNLPPRMRQVVNHGNGTIAVQEIAKIDQNAQKSVILTNKKRP